MTQEMIDKLNNLNLLANNAMDEYLFALGQLHETDRELSNKISPLLAKLIEHQAAERDIIRFEIQNILENLKMSFN